MQTSFKLTQERGTSATVTAGKVWKPVQYIPKVALRYPKQIPRKPIEIQKAPNEMSAVQLKTDSQSVDLIPAIKESNNKKTLKAKQISKKSITVKNTAKPKKHKDLKVRSLPAMVIASHDYGKRAKLDTSSKRKERSAVVPEDISSFRSSEINILNRDYGNRYLSYFNNNGSESSMDSNESFFRTPDVFAVDVANEPLPRVQMVSPTQSVPVYPWDLDFARIENAVVVRSNVFPDCQSAAQHMPRNEDEAESDSDFVPLGSDEDELEPGLEAGDGQLTSEVQHTATKEDDQPMPEVDQIEEVPELSIYENSMKTNKVLALLKRDVKWYGTVIVTLLSGRISINGYKARLFEPLTIYSPKGFNSVVISPMTHKRPRKALLHCIELEESFSRAQLDNIVGNFDNKRDAIVLLQRNSGAQNVLSTFSKHMSENVFPLITSSNRLNYYSQYLLNSFFEDALQAEGMQVPKVWTKLPLQPRTRLVIAGGKGVGKSTLLRYLLNRHLHTGPLLLVDLDIGQPELFMPQTVSCSIVDAPLLGPGFFLNKQPDIAFVVGHVNAVMCAEQYARAVKRLLKYCHENADYAVMPWLINTMGYNKGFGTELMALIVDAVKPTDLVQINSPKAINNFDVLLDRKSLSKAVPTIYVNDEFKLKSVFPSYTLHRLESVVPQNEQNRMMSAKDMRYSNLLARLSATLHGNAKHLTDCQPVKVSLDALKIVHLTSTEYSRDELIAGMEANVVYLCKFSTASHPVECVGIGVVRAVDHEAKLLYLVPAMPLERLVEVNCIVIGGDMCLPQSFIKDQGDCVTNNVPFVFVIDDSKSSRSVQQIYHRAPGFLGNPADKKAGVQL